MMPEQRPARMEITKLSDCVWEVWSPDSDSFYLVWIDPARGTIHCTCPAGRTHGLKGGWCKHIKAVLWHIAREELGVDPMTMIRFFRARRLR